jgi:hypothetical protein
VLRDAAELGQAAGGFVHRHHCGVSTVQMAASHDMHATACGDRQVGSGDSEAQSEGNVVCLEEPSISRFTPRELLDRLRRAHSRLVTCCTVTSTLCPNAGR